MIKFLIITFFSVIFNAEFKSERQYEIEQQLHAPCCWGGVIAEHDSPLAEGIKSIINALISESFNIDKISTAIRATYDNPNIESYFREIVKPNMTDAEIIVFFEQIHGEKVRALPDNIGLGWVAWKLPTFILFLSLIIGIIVVKKLQTKTHSPQPKIDQSKINSVEEAMKKMGI